MTLPASSTPRLLETCQFRLTGDSLDIILKAKFTIQMDSRFFMVKECSWCSSNLFLTQYPATTSYLLTGLHYNRPDEFKLQIYI